MALSNAQKTEIQRRALSGESGSALAREFGVSPSAISVIKNHYVAEVPTTVASKATKTLKVKEVAKKSVKVETFTAVVSSTKTSAKSITLPVGSTYGDLLKAANETGALEGVFKDINSSEKTRIQAIKDVIPAKAGTEYNVYLMPLKSSSGL